MRSLWLEPLIQQGGQGLVMVVQSDSHALLQATPERSSPPAFLNVLLVLLRLLLMEVLQVVIQRTLLARLPLPSSVDDLLVFGLHRAAPTSDGLPWASLTFLDVADGDQRASVDICNGNPCHFWLHVFPVHHRGVHLRLHHSEPVRVAEVSVLRPPRPIRLLGRSLTLFIEEGERLDEHELGSLLVEVLQNVLRLQSEARGSFVRPNALVKGRVLEMCISAAPATQVGARGLMVGLLWPQLGGEILV